MASKRGQVSRLQPPVSVRLKDEDVERVRRNHDERIRELQSTPLAGAKLIKNVILPVGVITPVAHGMGRPVSVFVSPIDNAGTGGGVFGDPRVVRAVNNGGFEASQFVALFASGWGADVRVDILVV